MARQGARRQIRAMPSRALAPAVLVALLALLPGPAGAQERPFPYELGKRDAVLAPLGLGLTLLAEQIVDTRGLSVSELAAYGPDDINPFDRPAARNWSPTWDDRSDWGRDALVVGSVLASFAPQVARGRVGNTVTLGALFAESYLLLAGSTRTVKRLAGRERPYLHNSGLSPEARLGVARDEGDAFESFWSGHAAAAFVTATLLSTVYQDVHGRSRTSDLLWASSLSVAAFTGYARVAAGKHYPSDVIVGAAVGSAIGVLVPRMHRRRGPASATVSASPAGIVVRIPLGGR